MDEMTRRHWKSHSGWQTEPGGEIPCYGKVWKFQSLTNTQLRWVREDAADVLEKAEISGVSFIQANEFQVWELFVLSLFRNIFLKMRTFRPRPVASLINHSIDVLKSGSQASPCSANTQPSHKVEWPRPQKACPSLKLWRWFSSAPVWKAANTPRLVEGSASTSPCLLRLQGQSAVTRDCPKDCNCLCRQVFSGKELKACL